jgi:hypothetical protein
MPSSQTLRFEFIVNVIHSRIVGIDMIITVIARVLLGRRSAVCSDRPVNRMSEVPVLEIYTFLVAVHAVLDIRSEADLYSFSVLRFSRMVTLRNGIGKFTTRS